MITILVAIVGALCTALSYFEGVKAERLRVLRTVDTYMNQATRDREEMIALAARAIRRRVEDPTTFK